MNNKMTKNVTKQNASYTRYYNEDFVIDCFCQFTKIKFASETRH